MDDPRLAARRKIVQAANRQRLYHNPLRRALDLYSMRQVQQAVRVCRHNRLVGNDVLRAAGFNDG